MARVNRMDWQFSETVNDYKRPESPPEKIDDQKFVRWGSVENPYHDASHGSLSWVAKPVQGQAQPPYKVETFVGNVPLFSTDPGGEFRTDVESRRIPTTVIKDLDDALRYLDPQGSAGFVSRVRRESYALDMRDDGQKCAALVRCIQAGVNTHVSGFYEHYAKGSRKCRRMGSTSDIDLEPLPYDVVLFNSAEEGGVVEALENALEMVTNAKAAATYLMSDSNSIWHHPFLYEEAVFGSDAKKILLDDGETPVVATLALPTARLLGTGDFYEASQALGKALYGYAGDSERRIVYAKASVVWETEIEGSYREKEIFAPSALFSKGSLLTDVKPWSDFFDEVLGNWTQSDPNLTTERDNLLNTPAEGLPRSKRVEDARRLFFKHMRGFLTAWLKEATLKDFSVGFFAENGLGFMGAYCAWIAACVFLRKHLEPAREDDSLLTTTVYDVFLQGLDFTNTEKPWKDMLKMYFLTTAWVLCKNRTERYGSDSFDYCQEFFVRASFAPKFWFGKANFARVAAALDGFRPLKLRSDSLKHLKDNAGELERDANELRLRLDEHEISNDGQGTPHANANGSVVAHVAKTVIWEPEVFPDVDGNQQMILQSGEERIGLRRTRLAFVTGSAVPIARGTFGDDVAKHIESVPGTDWKGLEPKADGKFSRNVILHVNSPTVYAFCHGWWSDYKASRNSPSDAIRGARVTVKLDAFPLPNSTFLMKGKALLRNQTENVRRARADHLMRMARKSRALDDGFDEPCPSRIKASYTDWHVWRELDHACETLQAAERVLGSDEGGSAYRLEWHVGQTYGGPGQAIGDEDLFLAHRRKTRGHYGPGVYTLWLILDDQHARSFFAAATHLRDLQGPTTRSGVDYDALQGKVFAKRTFFGKDSQRKKHYVPFGGDMLRRAFAADLGERDGDVWVDTRHARPLCVADFDSFPSFVVMKVATCVAELKKASPEHALELALRRNANGIGSTPFENVRSVVRARSNDEDLVDVAWRGENVSVLEFGGKLNEEWPLIDADLVSKGYLITDADYVAEVPCDWSLRTLENATSSRRSPNKKRRLNERRISVYSEGVYRYEWSKRIAMEDQNLDVLKVLDVNPCLARYYANFRNALMRALFVIDRTKDVRVEELDWTKNLLPSVGYDDVKEKHLEVNKAHHVPLLMSKVENNAFYESLEAKFSSLGGVRSTFSAEMLHRVFVLAVDSQTNLAFVCGSKSNVFSTRELGERARKSLAETESASPNGGRMGTAVELADALAKAISKNIVLDVLRNTKLGREDAVEGLFWGPWFREMARAYRKLADKHSKLSREENAYRANVRKAMRDKVDAANVSGLFEDSFLLGVHVQRWHALIDAVRELSYTGAAKLLEEEAGDWSSAVIDHARLEVMEHRERYANEEVDESRDVVNFGGMNAMIASHLAILLERLHAFCKKMRWKENETLGNLFVAYGFDKVDLMGDSFVKYAAAQKGVTLTSADDAFSFELLINLAISKNGNTVLVNYDSVSGNWYPVPGEEERKREDFPTTKAHRLGVALVFDGIDQAMEKASDAEPWINVGLSGLLRRYANLLHPDARASQSRYRTWTENGETRVRLDHDAQVDWLGPLTTRQSQEITDWFKTVYLRRLYALACLGAPVEDDRVNALQEEWKVFFRRILGPRFREKQ